VTTTSDSGARGEHDLNAIAAYAERRLDEDERARLERHLLGCVECRATLAAYARGALAVPETRATSRASGVGFARTSWLALAASAVLAVGVSLYMRTETPGPPPPRSRAPQSPVAGEVEPPVESPVVRLPSPPPAPPPAGDRGGLSTTRGGQRWMGGKTFRLEAGAWIDATYDPRKALPTSDVSGVEARAALLRNKPALKPYAALGAHVTVVFDGVVYRFDMQ
jgi:Putative zinc-finger